MYTVCSKKTTIGVFLGDIAFLMVSDWALVWCVEPFIRSLGLVCESIKEKIAAQSQMLQCSQSSDSV